MKIFGIGWHKTGTCSLGEALRRLGHGHCAGGFSITNRYIPHYLSSDYEPIFKLIDRYNSFEDLPFSALDFYKVLDQKYPGSKFILTLRKPERWLASLRKICTPKGESTDNLLKLSQRVANNLRTRKEASRLSELIGPNKGHKLGAFSGLVAYHQYAFGGCNIDGNESFYIETYQKHNNEVQEYFADRPNDLLVVNWEAGDGWDKLCNFLNKPLRSEPFPHANKSPR